MKKALHGVQSFLFGIADRRLTVYASSGCYYFFMSLVPVTMLLCALLPYTPFTQSLLLYYVDQYFTASLADVVRRIVSGIFEAGSSTITLSVILTVFSASACMRALINGMNAAYKVKSDESFLAFYLRAILAIILLLGALVLALGVMVYGGKILRLLSQYLPEYANADQVMSGSKYINMAAILFIAFTVLYKVMPSKRMNLFRQMPGAAFSAVIWMLFSAAFSWYVNLSNRFGAYGMLGTVMILMLWMYCVFLVLLTGGYINSCLEEHGVFDRRRRRKAIAAAKAAAEKAAESLYQDAAKDVKNEENI